MKARRLLLLLLLAAVASGCTRANPVVERVKDSGIEGTTVSGPQCPVEVAGSPCPDAPISVGLFVTRRGATEVLVTTRSDAQGRFRLVLPSGEYTIHPLDTAGPPSAAPVDVTVRPHAFTRVTIEFDSGIR